ncbi:DUF6520 family protein [Litoribacter populi]|uniref:DUF6520 family protein n=1 Tax=Litoribacter populi TaxID=2598460 RepID=UPI00117D7D6C|nr:DUF6520 family protein [Litoribacter populi]
MKKLIKSLPALGLALAATMAFAFNMPSNQEEYAIHPENGNWIPLSGLVEGRDYQCDDEGDCTYDAPNGNVIKTGTFLLME